MEDTSATYICFICTKNAKPGACIHDHLWFQLYQSCPGDRVLLRTKPKEKLDEVLALKAALEQTDIRDSMRLLRFYDSCFLGRLVYDLWQFMGVCQRLASQCISGRRMARRTFRWASNSECFEQNPEEMLHTDAAQVRLQRLRTIVENKKVLGYGLVETLRLQTLRYIHAYIFTRKLINKYCMTSFTRSAQQKFRVLFLPDLGCCRVLLDFRLVLVLTRVRKAWTGEVGLQVQPEPSVRFCPQDGKEDRSPKKSVKIQEQGLARHSIHSFTLVHSIAETHFAWGERPQDNLQLGKFGKQKTEKNENVRDVRAKNSEKVCHPEVFLACHVTVSKMDDLNWPSSRELQEKHIGQLPRKPGKLGRFNQTDQLRRENHFVLQVNLLIEVLWILVAYSLNRPREPGNAVGRLLHLQQEWPTRTRCPLFHGSRETNCNFERWGEVPQVARLLSMLVRVGWSFCQDGKVLDKAVRNLTPTAAWEVSAWISNRVHPERRFWIPIMRSFLSTSLQGSKSVAHNYGHVWSRMTWYAFVKYSEDHFTLQGPGRCCFQYPDANATRGLQQGVLCQCDYLVLRSAKMWRQSMG